MATETGLSRGQYKSVAPSPHKKSGCSPLCPACGDNCSNVPLQTEVKTRVVDNTDLRREVFKRLGHFRLDKNAANESIETADCRNEGYELEHTIGKGAYSVVKRARIKATKMQRSSKLSEHVTKCGHNKVAVKIIMKEHVDADFDKRFIEGECKALHRSKGHPNVIGVLDTFETSTHLYIVMELVTGGDLIDYVTKHSGESGGVDDDRARLMFKQLVLGLQHCHVMGVAHRDLKCDNILITEDETTLKITDFGFACTMASRRFMTETPCGSHSYAAPEILFKERYDPILADVWSCGVILYCLTNGNVPYYKVKLSQVKEVMQMQRISFHRTCTPEVKHLVRRILQFDPNKRLRLHDILNDPWVLGIKLKGGERMFRDTNLKQSAPSGIIREPFRLTNPSADQQKLLFSSVRFGVQSLASVIQLKSRLPNKERDLCLKTNFYKRRIERKNNTRPLESPPMAQVLQRIIDGSSTHETIDEQEAESIARKAVSHSIAFIQQTLSLPSVKSAKRGKKKKKPKKTLAGSYASLTDELVKQYSSSNNCSSGNCSSDQKNSSESLQLQENNELDAERKIRDSSFESKSSINQKMVDSNETDIIQNGEIIPMPHRNHENYFMNVKGQSKSVPDKTHLLDAFDDVDPMLSRYNRISRSLDSARIHPNYMTNSEHATLFRNEFSGGQISSLSTIDEEGTTSRQKHFTTPVLGTEATNNSFEEQENTAMECLTEESEISIKEINSEESCDTKDDQIVEERDSSEAISVPSSESLRTVSPGGDTTQESNDDEDLLPVSRKNSGEEFAGVQSADTLSSPVARKNSATLPGVRMKAGSDIAASVKVSGLQATKPDSAPTFTWQPCGKHKKYKLNTTTPKDNTSCSSPGDAVAKQRRLVPLQLTHVNVENMESVGPCPDTPIIRKWNTPPPAPKLQGNRNTTHLATSPACRAIIHCDVLQTSVTVETKPLSERDSTSPYVPPTHLGLGEARDSLDKVDSVSTVPTWRLTKTPPLIERVNRALEQPSSQEKFPKIRNLRFESGNKFNPPTDKRYNH